METRERRWVVRKGIVNSVGPRDSGRMLFKENNSLILCGRTGSGKTTFIYRLLKNANDMFTNEFNRKIHILYCYTSNQHLFDKMKEEIPNIRFHYGLPTKEDIEKYGPPKTRHLIIVMDDLMREVIESNEMSDYFTIKAHHEGATVIFVSHNLFQQGRYSKTITGNTGYFVLFENPRTADQMITLSKQVYPGMQGIIARAYKMAMERQPYSYIVLDMTTNVPDYLRMRGNVFPGEMMTLYTTDDGQ